MYNNYFQGCVRYEDKTATMCEQGLFASWWSEQIAQYGQIITYQVNNFSLSAADPILGEDTPQVFSDPVEIIAVVNLQMTQFLSKWSLMGDDFTTILIPISSFQDTFGPGAEPKSGDIFKLYEYGQGRPGGRDGKMFEVTERLDEDNNLTNQLMGYYVWTIKAKRYQYTFEPNVSAEAVTDSVYDNNFFGRLSGGENPPTAPKAYPTESADQLTENTIFNYLSTNSLDSVYGGYQN